MSPRGPDVPTFPPAGKTFMVYIQDASSPNLTANLPGIGPTTMNLERLSYSSGSKIAEQRLYISKGGTSARLKTSETDIVEVLVQSLSSFCTDAEAYDHGTIAAKPLQRNPHYVGNVLGQSHRVH
jgi:hypothetical protein